MPDKRHAGKVFTGAWIPRELATQVKARPRRLAWDESGQENGARCYACGLSYPKHAKAITEGREPDHLFDLGPRGRCRA